MKRFCLLCKRQVKQPFFLFLCLLLPFSCLLISHLEQRSSSALCIGLFAEAPDEFTAAVFSELCSDARSITFEVFSDEEQMRTEVMRGSLDCAYRFCADFHTRLLDGSYKKTILCYTSTGTMLKDLSEEVVFASVFKQLGADILTDYALSEANAIDVQLSENQLSALYQKYLYGDQVFSLRYEYLDSPIQPSAGSASAVTMPVRGLIAVFLFTSGLAGGVTWLQDRVNKLPVSAVHTLLIPLLFMGISALLTLLLTGEGKGVGQELIALILYSLLICVFVRVLLLFIKRPAILSASIPVFVLGSLIFCPVFINLAALLPFFQIMEKLFLPYYYILLS